VKGRDLMQREKESERGRGCGGRERERERDARGNIRTRTHIRTHLPKAFDGTKLHKPFLSLLSYLLPPLPPLIPPHPPPSALPLSWRASATAFTTELTTNKKKKKIKVNNQKWQGAAGERNYIDYCIDYNMANSPLPKAHILKSPLCRAFI